jgi:TPR repeat protein
MTARAGLLAVAIASAVTVAPSARAQSSRAETSAWQQRLSPAPKSEPKAGTKVRSSKVDPSQAPKASLGHPAAAPALRPSLGPSTAPVRSDGEAAAPGSDAAYEAFDQGKYLTALAMAAKQAEGGDAVAHTLVARIHAEGLGVPQDTKLAAQWYARGAELGDPEAALGLGTLFARGDGVAQDYGKAAELFERAAAKGHAEAAYNLALLFLAGKGKPELPHRGFMLMSYAAEKGVTPAMYDLGTLYATGTGTTANVFESAKWIGKAANAGYPEAEVEFAIILLKDHDVPPEQREKLRRRGFELLRSAARKGITVAQNRLAHCHREGIGTAKDPVEAAKWHLVAKAGGYEDAGLDKLVSGLAKADRQKATAAAAEWREQTLLE